MTPCSCSVDDKRGNASDAITMTRCSRGVGCSCLVCPAKSGTALEMKPVSATVGADKAPHFLVANTTTTSTSQAASVGEILSHAGRFDAHKPRIISIGCHTTSQLHATGLQVSHVPRTFLPTCLQPQTFSHELTRISTASISIAQSSPSITLSLSISCRIAQSPRPRSHVCQLGTRWTPWMLLRWQSRSPLCTRQGPPLRYRFHFEPPGSDRQMTE